MAALGPDLLHLASGEGSYPAQLLRPISTATDSPALPQTPSRAVAEQRAPSITLISSRQQDVGKSTPWKTQLWPGTKTAIRAATQFSVSAARICSGGKVPPVHSRHSG